MQTQNELPHAGSALSASEYKTLEHHEKVSKAEKDTHIKGRLLGQAMILFNCVHFQNGTSLKGKNLLQEGASSFLYEQFLIV